VSLALHNTATRQKELFVPVDPGHVRMYVCGPTVYQRIHVGNGRALVVFDVLFRLLRHLYPRVTYVRNITDVEDKIINAARETGEAIDALTARTTRAFHEDASALGCLEPDIEPRATDNIPGMIALIEALIANGHAYAADGHVLFHVPSFPEYGALSGRDREEQIAGARVEVAPYKKDPADFVLWKPSTADQPGWESPWGFSRPGWHIECSAMSERFLGLPFDIHGGGQDLVFPHHENEIAQTRCAHGLPHMARYWVHNGFLTVGDEKMSKSLGNVLTVGEALELAPGEAIRLAILGAHYRHPLDLRQEGLDLARATLDRMYLALERLADVPASAGTGAPEAFVAALSDDLNTPKALAVLHGLVTDANKADAAADRARLKAEILGCGALVGLLGQAPEAWLRAAGEGADEIEQLVRARNEARRSRDFAEADRIRDELSKQGVILEDGPGGTTWRRAS
jgi:cysteinyl-tRNA synthetase